MHRQYDLDMVCAKVKLSLWIIQKDLAPDSGKVNKSLGRLILVLYILISKDEFDPLDGEKPLIVYVFSICLNLLLPLN